MRFPPSWKINMIEIERKFLVISEAFKDQAFKYTRIIQGFLSTNKKRWRNICASVYSFTKMLSNDRDIQDVY